MMIAIEKAFDLRGIDIVELSTERESLKNKIGSYHRKFLEESKAKLLKQFNNEKLNYVVKKIKQLEKKQ